MRLRGRPSAVRDWRGAAVAACAGLGGLALAVLLAPRLVLVLAGLAALALALAGASVAVTTPRRHHAVPAVPFRSPARPVGPARVPDGSFSARAVRVWLRGHSAWDDALDERGEHWLLGSWCVRHVGNEWLVTYSGALMAALFDALPVASVVSMLDAIAVAELGAAFIVTAEQGVERER